MVNIIVVLHVLVCLAMIFIVLLQHGRGAEMGAAFGGSNQTIFGSGGAGTFLGKITTAAAIAFMVTSLTLAFFANRRTSTSRIIGQDESPVTQQAAPEAPMELPPVPE